MTDQQAWLCAMTVLIIAGIFVSLITDNRLTACQLDDNCFQTLNR